MIILSVPGCKLPQNISFCLMQPPSDPGHVSALWWICKRQCYTDFVTWHCSKMFYSCCDIYLRHHVAPHRWHFVSHYIFMVNIRSFQYLRLVCSVKCYDDWWKMNLKGPGWKLLSPNPITIRAYICRLRIISRKSSVRIADVRLKFEPRNFRLEVESVRYKLTCLVSVVTILH
jgi:hypothetical protein